MTRSLNTYYLVNFLYNFARVLPHSILTILLMEKGITLAEISLIQSFYMLTALVSEFPSGVLTEIIGEKKMYQLSLILLGISYCGVYVFDNVLLLSLMWGIYGLSSAVMSGTLDAYFYKVIKKKGKNIKEFNVKNRYSILVSSLFGALIGSLLYKYIGVSIYLVSIIILILTLLILTFFIKIEHELILEKVNNNSVSYQIKQIIKETLDLKSDLKLMYLIFLTCIFQIVVQLYFQYWQVFFQQKGVKITYFGVIYALFQVIAIASTYVFSKCKFKKTPFELIVGLLGLISFPLLFSIFSSNVIFFIVFFTIFLLAFNVYDNVLEYLILHNVKSQYMSSFMSLFGTLSTVVSTIILWMMSIFLSFQTLENVGVFLIIIFLILSLVICYRYYLVDRK